MVPQTLLTSGITDDPSATGKGKTRAVDAEDAEDAAPSKGKSEMHVPAGTTHSVWSRTEAEEDPLAAQSAHVHA